MAKTVHLEQPPKGTIHFNIKFKSGGLLNGLLATDLFGLRPAEIEWVFLVEQKRKATPEEIKALCKLDPKR